MMEYWTGLSLILDMSSKSFVIPGLIRNPVFLDSWFRRNDTLYFNPLFHSSNIPTFRILKNGWFFEFSVNLLKDLETVPPSYSGWKS